MTEIKTQYMTKGKASLICNESDVEKLEKDGYKRAKKPEPKSEEKTEDKSE